MSRDRNALSGLVPLADAEFEREAAALRALERLDAKLRDQAQALRRPASLIDTPPIPVRAVADGLHNRWRTRELARLEQERAKLRIERLQCMDRARTAFGRSQVLAALAGRSGRP